MFFAALGKFQRGGALEPGTGDGFVVITADSEGGMLDIHDRRPVVLSPQRALRWLDPELDPGAAGEIAQEHGETADAFRWHTVGREVGNVRNEGPSLALPLSRPS